MVLISHFREAAVTVAQPEKKEYVFKNKKEAIEAFKNLLREKVNGYWISVLRTYQWEQPFIEHFPS